MHADARGAHDRAAIPFRYGLQTAVIPSAHTYGLPTDEWLLPQALKEAGYKTAIVGKWHLGHADRKYWPRQRGFDYQYGPLIGEIDYFTHEQHGVTRLVPRQQAGQGGGLRHDAARQRGREAHRAARPGARRSSSTSTFTAPHTPYQAPQEYLDRYKDIADPSRRAYAGDDHAPWTTRSAACSPRSRRRACATTRSSSSRATTAAPATPMFAGEGDMSKITIPCDNGPYRDGKGSLYEGGTRVAALANWPGRIKAGHRVERHDPRRRHVPDAGSASPAARRPRASRSTAWTSGRRSAKGKPSPRDEVVYNVEPFRAGVRQGDWKLVWRAPLPSAGRALQHRRGPVRDDQPRGTGTPRRSPRCRSARTSSRR